MQFALWKLHYVKGNVSRFVLTELVYQLFVSNLVFTSEATCGTETKLETNHIAPSLNYVTNKRIPYHEEKIFLFCNIVFLIKSIFTSHLLGVNCYNSKMLHI